MKKYNVQFLRRFDVEVQADNVGAAQLAVEAILAQFEKDSCKVLSIVPEGYVEPMAPSSVEAVAGLSKEAKEVLERNGGLAKKVAELTDQPEPEVA